MYTYLCFLSFLLSVALGAAAQQGLQLYPPTKPMYACETATFTWTGGTPDYSFFYAVVNRNGSYTDTLVRTNVLGTNITFPLPFSGE